MENVRRARSGLLGVADQQDGVRVVVTVGDTHVPTYAHSRYVYAVPFTRVPSVVDAVAMGVTDQVRVTDPETTRSSLEPVAFEVELGVQVRDADGVLAGWSATAWATHSPDVTPLAVREPVGPVTAIVLSLTVEP